MAHVGGGKVKRIVWIWSSTLTQTFFLHTQSSLQYSPQQQTLA